MNKRYTNFIFGALIGAGIAAVIALLFAPESGEELRADVKKKASDAKDSAEDYMNIAKDKGSDLAQTAGEAGSEMLEHGKQTADQLQDDLSGTGGFKDSIDEAKETAKIAKEIDKDIAKDKADDVQNIAEDTKEEVETQ